MPQEPRKATDILLELESKMNMMLDIIRTQDLNIKILSNKLNDAMGQLRQQNEQKKIIVEAVNTTPMPKAPEMPPGFVQLPAGDPERTIPIQAESTLPQSNEPKGFRRTSRPESFAGDDAYLNRSANPPEDVRMPVQLPPGMKQQQLQQQPQPQPQPQPQQVPPGRQQMVPPPGRSQSETFAPPPPTPEYANRKGAVMPGPQRQPSSPYRESQPPQGAVPIMQRIVDKNGKSIFLADVEVTDLSTSQPVFKTRTNGTGKWMASLGIGAYQVKIGKRASGNKEKLEAVQDIQVDGSQSPLELPMLIIK
jgi:hypothetical protein